MLITPISTLKDNYVWTLINTPQHNALIIDPGEAAPVIHFLEKHALTLNGILLTHHHWDHTNGTTELQERYQCPIFGPGLLSQTITIPQFPITFTVIPIPGHTLDHIAFYAPGMLFCGDTLFSAGCGRVFEGTAEQMYASLQTLAALPDNTEVYCGHEYTANNLRFAQTVEPENKAIQSRIMDASKLRAENKPTLPSSIKIEKETNPFLRCEQLDVKIAVEKYSGKKMENAVEVFATLRKWKDGF